jgi:hypothetical protein
MPVKSTQFPIFLKVFQFGFECGNLVLSKAAKGMVSIPYPSFLTGERDRVRGDTNESNLQGNLK